MNEQKPVESNPEQQAAEDAVFGSGDFFDKLESGVNGMVSDGSQAEAPATEATHEDGGTEQVTHNTSQNGSTVDWDNENNPYMKRYKDSSREAVKMSQQLRTLQPFIPVLEAMKRDSGLVDHVRDYLKEGGAPSKSIQQKLKLDEDFIFDANDAVQDPDSDSAKVMNAQIDNVVQSRVGDILKKEKMNAAKTQQQLAQRRQEVEFRKKHNMSDEDYKKMVQAAKNHKLSIEDIYYILNKDKAAQNVANSTKKDMLSQMKNVRDIPTSASDSNNQDPGTKPEDKLFEGILGLDNDVDNLFG
tara:strand:+ start:8534 stop:9433 length:900 start_codon:yes stop_codon:yes gene_type:complete